MRAVFRTKKLLLLLIAASSSLLVYFALYRTDFDIKPKDVLQTLAHNIVSGANSSPTSSKQRGARAHMTHAQVGRRFQERLQTLREACKVYTNSTLFRPLHKSVSLYHVGPFMPVMNFSLEYCGIQKTGSTTWRGVFNGVRAAGNKLTSLSKEERMRQWKKRKRVVFLFVREPYSRLLSAYVDKLFSPNTLFWNNIGKYIIRTFRENASQTSLRCGHDVTFPEFIRYVIHSQRTGQHRDGHFVPTHDHCNVCKVPYQYVGHLETMPEDMSYLLNISQAPYKYTQSFQNSTISNNAGWVLKTMRKKIKTCMSLQEACRRLWRKWHIRGIIDKSLPPPPLSVGEAEKISKEGFVQLALSALAKSGPKEIRRQQKQEALREAFASVPLEDKMEIERLLALDFALFGFPPRPEEVFPSGPPPSGAGDGFSYFNTGPGYPPSAEAQRSDPTTSASDDVRSVSSRHLTTLTSSHIYSK